MLNMLPKFELVPMSRYFITLPKARRPSRMPAVQHARPRSSRMMSAASRATSTARRHRDADVGRVQRRRVVDAVAEEADDVAAALEREDDAVLLRRRDAREDATPAPRRARARRRHPLDLVAEDDLRSRRAPTCSQTWRATSSLSPVRILTVDAVARAARASVSARVGQDGSAKPTKPASTRSRLVVARVGGARLDPPVRDGEHAEAVARSALVDGRAARRAARRRAAGAAPRRLVRASHSAQDRPRARPW